MPAFRAREGCLVVDLRLTPKSGSDRIDGPARLSDGREVLVARVRAAPEAGAANIAAMRLVAAALGVPPSAVEVIRGHRGRQKQLRVAGDPAGLLDRAERLWPTSASATTRPEGPPR